MIFLSRADALPGRSPRALRLGYLFGGLLLVALGAVAVAFEADWEMLLIYDAGAAKWEMEGELAVAWSRVGWDIGCEIAFEESVWDRVEVEASFEAELGRIGAAIRWDPVMRTFTKLSLEAWIEAAGIDAKCDFDLYATRCWTDLKTAWEVAGCEIDIAVRLGASKRFCVDFYRLDAAVSLEVEDIPIDVDARFTAKRGFERLDVETAFTVPPWLAIDVDARWTADGRTVSFESEMETLASCEGASASIELLGEAVLTDLLHLEGLRVTGLGFEAAWNGVWVESRTSFDPGRNKSVTGHKAYGRAVGVGCDVDGRCDREVEVALWALSVDPSRVRDWDRTVAEISVRLDASLEFSLAASLESGALHAVELEVELGG